MVVIKKEKEKKIAHTCTHTYIYQKKNIDDRKR